MNKNTDEFWQFARTETTSSLLVTCGMSFSWIWRSWNKSFAHRNKDGLKFQRGCTLHAFTISFSPVFKCLCLWLSISCPEYDGMCEITCYRYSSGGEKSLSGLLVTKLGPETLSLRLLGRKSWKTTGPGSGVIFNQQKVLGINILSE